MKFTEQTRLQKLTEWAQSHGSALHPSLELYYDDVTKFSVRVKDEAQTLEPGFTAVKCHIGTTLSYLNALTGSPLGPLLSPQQPPQEEPSPCPSFPPRFMNSIAPHVIGRFFLIQQYLLGTASFWHPYIASLPQPENISSWALPAFWPEDDIDFLEGTNAYVAIQEIQANVKREFKHARKIIKEENFSDWQDYTRLLYNWAFCIFTSRSFRPSLIVSEATRQNVVSRHLLHWQPHNGCDLDDFSILQPLFDIANHSIASRYDWDVSSDPSCCRLVCRDAYGPGDQVYNNYGLKTNSELLLGYGFTLPEGPQFHNDYYHLRKRNDETGSRDPENLTEASMGGKPKDFLISLRPMSDKSSLVGRTRQLSANVLGLHAIPDFAHFEHALIYDLAAMMSNEEERGIIERSLSGGEDPLEVQKVDYAGSELQPPTLNDKPPAGLEQLVSRIKEALCAKLQYDLQRLVDVDESEEASGVKPVTANQRLALEYRTQSKRVLCSALQALGSPVPVSV